MSLESSTCILLFAIFSIGTVIEDIRTLRIKRSEIALGIASVIAAKALLGRCDWVDTLAGGAAGIASFLALITCFPGRLGDGDAWLSAFIGTAFGFWVWNWSLLVSAFLGIVWTFVLSFSGKQGTFRDIRLPFAPFMFIGAIAVSVIRGLSSW